MRISIVHKNTLQKCYVVYHSMFFSSCLSINNTKSGHLMKVVLPDLSALKVLFFPALQLASTSHLQWWQMDVFLS